MNTLRLSCAALIALTLLLAGCQRPVAKSIPDRDNVRCLLALEVWAAQCNFTGGPFLGQDLADAPPALRRTCAWLTAPAAPSCDLPAYPARPQSIAAGLADADAEVQAITLLLVQAKRDDTVPVDRLRELTRSPDSDVRLLAAETLGVVQPEQATPVLVERLQRDADAFVRYKAAWALGQLRATEGVTALIAALDDGDFDVVRQAAAALGNIGDPRCIPALLNQAGAPDAFVRETIATVLKRFAAAGHGPSLRAAFHAMPGDRRHGVREALGKYGGGPVLEAIGLPMPTASPRPPDQDDNPKALARDWRQPARLRPLLTHHDAEVAKEAAATLGLVGDPGAAPLLLDAYREADPDTKAMILLSLGLLGDASAAPLLREALNEPDTDLLRRATVALGLVGDASDAARLRGLLRHTDSAVRARAAMALGLLGSPAPPLVDALADPSVRVRVWAAWAIGQTRDRARCTALEKAAGEKTPFDHVAYEHAASALGCAKTPTDPAGCWRALLGGMADAEAAVTLHKMWHRGKPELDENFAVDQ